MLLPKCVSRSRWIAQRGAGKYSTGVFMQSISHGMHRWRDRITDMTIFLYRAILIFAHAVHNSRFILHANGKLRRFVLVHCRKKYIQRQLSARQGACCQCGICCNLLFTCPMLTQQGRCLVYGSCRPESCKTFPIDQRDLDEVKLYNGKCGFHFDEKCTATAGKTGSS